MGQPGICHLAQIFLDIKHFRGGDMQTGIERLVAYHGIDCRDHTGLDPGGKQDVVNKIDRGGLPIGASDPDHG